MPAGYSNKVMDHFMHPRNVGEMENPDGIGHVGNPVCVAPGTLVHCNSDVKAASEVEIGKTVLGHDGNYHQVQKIYRRDYSGKFFSIKVHNLGETATTPDHHILALKLNDQAYKFKASIKAIPDWYCAEELKKGDVAIYPIPKETVDVDEIELDIPKLKWDFKSKTLPDKVKVDQDFLRLAGYFLAEGYSRTQKSRGTLGFVFHENEIYYLTDVVSIVGRLFGIAPSSARNRHHSCVLEFYSARLTRFFEQLFGKGAANKKLPHWVMLLPAEKQKELLSGLWRGDGWISGKGAKYVTISKQLAFQIRQLLLRQKMIFSFLTNKAHGMHKESYSIYIKEDGALKKLSEIVGIPIARKPKKKSPVKSWFDEDNYYAPIRSIKISDYKGKVYNLEVSGCHSYVSSALALHNCGDIMEMYIRVKDNIITDAKFKTFGCGAAIATSSMATELIKGKTIEEALKVTNQAVAEALGGLPKVKMHCSVLAEEAFQAAINDYLLKTTGKGLPGYKPHDEPLEEHEHHEH